MFYTYYDNFNTRFSYCNSDFEQLYVKARSESLGSYKVCTEVHQRIIKM